MFIYSYINRPPRRAVEFSRPSVTEKDHHSETDIGELISKMSRGIPVPENSAPKFGDFTQYADFQELMNKKVEAERAFLEIDPKIRSRFGNDPAKLFEYVTNPDNIEESIRMGLISREDVIPEVNPDSPPPKEEVQAV